MAECLKLKGMENTPLNCYAVIYSLIEQAETIPSLFFLFGVVLSTEAEIV